MGSSTSENTHADHIPIGYVRKAHGIRGDVVVRGLVDDISERICKGASLTTGEQPARSLSITSVRMTGSDYLVHLSDVETRNDAESLVGVQFVVHKSQRRELGNNEWWVDDLVGCGVVDLYGKTIGTVTAVVSGAAQDRLVVETSDDGRAEIPLVGQLVPEVDTAARRIVVDLPEGLIE